MRFAYASIDSSGDFRFIALVLVLSKASLPNMKPHVAGLRKEKNYVIGTILSEFKAGNLYGVCLKTRYLYRIKAPFRKSKKALRKRYMSMELNRIKQHLISRNMFASNMAIYVDREFLPDVQVISEIFVTDRIYVGKSKEIIPADVLAYLNLKKRYLLKELKNVVEI